MPMSWSQLVHLVQLSRVALVLTAVSNSWLIVFLSTSGLDPSPGRGAAAYWPLPVTLLLAGIASAGLHTYGIALNDVLDARHDRLFSPDRPIPAGRVGATSGIVLALINLFLAIAASTFLGPVSVLLCLATAAAILFYDAAGKFLPAVGIIALGLIRAVNMFIPNPGVGFVFPVWLTMTHVLICAAVAHHIGGKRPRLRPADLGWLCAGWAFWTLALVSWMTWRDTLKLNDAPYAWWGPIIAVALFLVSLLWVIRPGRVRRRSHRAAGTHFMQHALLWLIVYDASWLAACGLWWQAAAHLALFLAAYGSIFLGRALAWAQFDPHRYVTRRIIAESRSGL